MHNRPSDSQILTQVDKIRSDAVSSSELVSEFLSLDHLARMYEGNIRYSEKIQTLRAEWRLLRQVRPDGNCFYRAYLFGILELFLSLPAPGVEIERFRVRLEKLSQDCKRNGYDGFAVDDFSEYVDEKLQEIAKTPTIEYMKSVAFSDVSGEGYFIALLRCCCGSFIKQHSEEFEAFLPQEYSSCWEFVKNEVDPMFRECDNIQIVALSRALQVPLTIVYLDQSEGEASRHMFGPEDRSGGEVTLLYKPGHYDILY